jgi:hypothetical protein
MTIDISFLINFCAIKLVNFETYSGRIRQSFEVSVEASRRHCHSPKKSVEASRSFGHPARKSVEASSLFRIPFAQKPFISY